MGKSISASVGHQAVNFFLDAVTVQFLLNCVPDTEGGPVEELVIDGLVGPKTIGAIIRFQQAHLPFTDGRVDPEHRGGKTIVELNKFDPTPDVPITPPSVPKLPPSPGFPSGGGKGKKRGKKSSGTPSIPLPEFPSFPPPTPSGGGGGKGKGKGKKG